jgi:hypothetical protein
MRRQGEGQQPRQVTADINTIQQFMAVPAIANVLIMVWSLKLTFE